MSGQLITIFNLDTTEPRYKQIKLDQWSGICYSIPRNMISKAINEKETDLNRPCIYVLTKHGENEVYIGQAEKFADRIKDHMAKKDFWDMAIMFTIPDGTFTKAHAGYVEALLIEDLVDKKHHGNIPTGSALPPEFVGGATMFTENVKYLLLSVFGITETFKSDGIQTYEIESDDTTIPIDVPRRWTNRKGSLADFKHMSDKEFVLLAGSIISGEPLKSFNATDRASKSPFALWKSITSDASKVLEIQKDGKKMFTTLVDISFESPSSMFSVVSAQVSNGRDYLNKSVVK